MSADPQSPLGHLRDFIISSQDGARQKRRYDDLLAWEAADLIAEDVEKTVRETADLNRQTLKLIDTAMRAKPMQRAGALKKARAMAAKAAKGAESVAEAV